MAMCVWCVYVGGGGAGVGGCFYYESKFKIIFFFGGDGVRDYLQRIQI